VSQGFFVNTPLPAGTLFRPSLLARAINREARTAVVLPTEHGLVQELSGDRKQLDWDDVVGVAPINEDEMVSSAPTVQQSRLDPAFTSEAIN
jgi:hypothetical protein